ncbi:MAG: hypothetical protein ACI84E_001890, partial [Planctomycetota bacterium]
MGRGYTVASEMDLHFRQGLLMRRPLAKRDFLKGVDGQPNPASDEAPWHSDLISEF